MNDQSVEVCKPSEELAEYDVVTEIPGFTLLVKLVDVKPSHCILCNAEFFDDPATGNSPVTALDLMREFSRILKIKNLEKILPHHEPDLPDGRSCNNGRSVICTNCRNVVLEAIEIQNKILDLQGQLGSLVKKIKSTLHQSYLLKSREPPDDEEELAGTCRKTLFQVLNPCRVEISKCLLTELVPAQAKHDETGRVVLKSTIPSYQSGGVKNEFDSSSDATKVVRSPEESDSFTDFMKGNDNAYRGGESCDEVPSFEPCGKDDPSSLSESEYSDFNEDTMGTVSQVLNRMRRRVRKASLEGEFPCELCDKIFSKSLSLSKHQKRSHGVDRSRKKILPNQCQFCGKEFNEPELSQNNEDKSTYRCNPVECDCGQTFTTFHHFKYHHYRKCPKRRENAEMEKLKPRGNCVCDECGKKFDYESNLKYHKLNIHDQKFRYYCEICGHGTQVQSMLKRHMIVHSNLKPLQCDQCDYKCRRTSQMHYHKRVHTNEKPYLCTECGKSFVTNNKLQQHAASHVTTKEFPCPQCGKMFASKHYVTNHVNTIHRRLPRKPRLKKPKISQDEPMVQSVPAAVEVQLMDASELTEEVMQTIDINNVTVRLVDSTTAFDLIDAEPDTFVEIG